MADLSCVIKGKDWRCVVSGAEGDGEQNIAPLSTSSSSSNEEVDTKDDKQNKEKSSEPTTLDLRELRPMTDYRKEMHYERFGTQDMLTYSVNFHDDGELLRCVCPSHCRSKPGIIDSRYMPFLYRTLRFLAC